ncbi:iron-containing alcohol dehydrogenase [Longirhabdus pacifica]|uniref:iron-containing alcohol dehydrogenase n=1 Tax=Longirhabdus pacifica TaxID=2305227 RepID=UPI001F0C500C|nr:iron-containing alcohol dehydrogenase [Longirhabdus pacifica]
MSNSLYAPRVVTIGSGSLQKIGEYVVALHAKHVFVIAGSLLSNETISSTFQRSIEQHGLDATYFTHTKGEPTTEHLQAVLMKIKECGADCIVAIGGGSVMDLAKAASVFAVNEQMSLDAIPNENCLRRLSFIAIPTTAGTGSEATKITVIKDVKTGVKKNPGHHTLIPDVAILDPELTISLPQSITAYTGMDALAHAMEAYVSTKATPCSDFYALESMRLIAASLPLAYQNGNDIKAREQMLLGSYYAGIAFSNASTNLAHAAGRPLGAHYNMPHGLCVALLLPFVVEYGLHVCEERYATVAGVLYPNNSLKPSYSNAVAAKKVMIFIEQCNDTFGILQAGWEYLNKGQAFEDIVPTLVKDAMAGNGIRSNQIVPTEEDVEEIYKKLWSKITQP